MPASVVFPLQVSVPHAVAERYSLEVADGSCFPNCRPHPDDGQSRPGYSRPAGLHPDRCNYKCVYCRTGEVSAQYPELKIDEYLRLITLFVGLGVEKVRLTGGEPLLRHRAPLDLIRELARLRTLTGEPLDLALTTNGHLLEDLAKPLKTAGLQRATVSMDAVDARHHSNASRGCRAVTARYCAGSAPRADAGLTPLKINCVLMRGFNDDQVENFAHVYTAKRMWRFGSLNFMPLEEGRLWSPEIVVPFKEIVQEDQPHSAAGASSRARSSRTARLRIPSPTAEARSGSSRRSPQAFCGACSRVRLTSDSKDQNVSFFPSRARPATEECGQERATRHCAHISGKRCRARRRATI